MSEMIDFLFHLFPDKPPLFGTTAFFVINNQRVPFYVWALKGGRAEEIKTRFIADMQAWASNAGADGMLVIRQEPFLSFSGDDVVLYARLAMIDGNLNAVPPTFTPKEEGAEADRV